MNLVFVVHGWLGFLVILAVVAAAGLSLYEWLQKEAGDEWSTVYTAVVGLMDLQVLLGVVLFFLMSAAARPSLEHPVIMILSLVIVHVAKNYRGGWRFGGFLVALILMIRGFMVVAPYRIFM